MKTDDKMEASVTNATDAMTSQYMADVVQAAIECLCANGFQSRTHRLTEVRDRLRATPAGSASGEVPFAVVGGVEFDSPQALCAAHADLQAEVARLREDAARPKPAEHFGMAIIADDTLHPGEIAFICRGKRTVFSIRAAMGSANGQADAADTTTGNNHEEQKA